MWLDDTVRRMDLLPSSISLPGIWTLFVSSPPFRKGIHTATKNQASSCCEASHTVLNASENTLPSRLPMPMLYQAIDLRWLKPRPAGWRQLFWYAFCRHISEHRSLPYRCRVPAIEYPRVSNIFSTMNNKKEYRLRGRANGFVSGVLRWIWRFFTLLFVEEVFVVFVVESFKVLYTNGIIILLNCIVCKWLFCFLLIVNLCAKMIIILPYDDEYNK